MPGRTSQRLMAFTGMILGWATVFLQFYLIIKNSEAGIVETIIRFFSYFTILTNILVATCFTALFVKNDSGLTTFFEKPGVQTAIALYILIVGLIYNLILRSLWHPTGLQKFVDESLHSIMPVWYLIYWLLFGTKQKSLLWRQILLWLLYPFIYCCYILIRGAISGFYPYPFVDVAALGFPRVLLNTGIMLLLFLLISVLLVGIARLDKSTGTS